MEYLKKLFGLENKVALVTGASRGLGQGMSLALAQAGAHVVLLARNRQGLENTCQQITKVGGSCEVIVADITDRSTISMVINSIVNKHGKLDVLVNNAGIIRRAPAVEFADEDWQAVIDTNLNALFFWCREAGRVMIEQQSGKIINIASLLSFQGGITVPAYAAAKGGVAQLTKALANEWAKHNVQVNAIAPGYFETDNTRPLLENKQRNQEITARIPTGRWGQPADLAGTVIFLASAASDYVNGHILVVDGGWLAR